MLSILLTLFAQFKVTRNFNKYSRVQGVKGFRGVDVAISLLRKNGIYDVQVERTHGHLTDHYSSREKVIRLSDSVYNSRSLSAIAVAAHEVGHAIQDNEGYLFLKVRHFLFPLVNFTSRFVWLLISLGLLFRANNLITIGVLFFGATVLLQIITLPVEFDASRRALNELEEGEYIYPNEVKGSRKVLFAAALTYIASTIHSVLNLLRLLSMREEE